MPMRWIGGRQAPVTARHFLTYRDEAASAADMTFWIARIPRPILLVRDAADSVVLPFEPYMLLSAARAEGSLVPETRYVLLPNPRPPSLRGTHLCRQHRAAGRGDRVLARRARAVTLAYPVALGYCSGR